jgi:sugar phosphate isomerase/epimerase
MQRKNQMKLGISSYSFTWAIGVENYYPKTRINEIELLNHARILGIKLVQIADNMPLHKMSFEQRNNLSEKALEYGMEIEIGANKMLPENLEEYIKIAEMMKSRILRFVFDGDDFKPEVTDVISIIKNVLPELKKSNIILAIENHERLLASDFKYIIEQVNSPFVGMCLDCANSLGNGEGLFDVVSELAPYTVNFHLKEVSIKRKYHKMGFDIEGSPFGQGILPLEKMLSILPENCRTAILEQWTPPEKTIEETIDKELDWAKKSLEYLRKYFDSTAVG